MLRRKIRQSRMRGEDPVYREEMEEELDQISLERSQFLLGQKQRAYEVQLQNNHKLRIHRIR